MNINHVILRKTFRKKGIVQNIEAIVSCSYGITISRQALRRIAMKGLEEKGNAQEQQATTKAKKCLMIDSSRIFSYKYSLEEFMKSPLPSCGSRWILIFSQEDQTAISLLEFRTENDGYVFDNFVVRNPILAEEYYISEIPLFDPFSADFCANSQQPSLLKKDLAQANIQQKGSRSIPKKEEEKEETAESTQQMSPPMIQADKYIQYNHVLKEMKANSKFKRVGDCA